MDPGLRGGLVISLRAGRSGFQFLAGVSDFSCYSKHPDRLWAPPNLLLNEYWLIYQGHNGLRLTLTTPLPVLSIYALASRTDNFISLHRHGLPAFCSLAVEINVLNGHSAAVGSHVAPFTDMTSLREWAL